MHRLFLAAFLAAALLVAASPASAIDPAPADLDGYPRVLGPCHFEFPKDHGPHPDFRTEWWYYTGNVTADSGERFGFELTFFRRRILPAQAEKDWPQKPSAWRTGQVMAAHAAVSDITGGKFHHSEKLARAAVGLSGWDPRGDFLTVFLEGWKVFNSSAGHSLHASAEDFSFDLDLTPLKPPTAHGDSGYSRKGQSAEQASCYYSLTRMKTAGRLRAGEKEYRVEGFSWMDHEYSSAPLDPSLSGWDWFGLRLSDGSDLMIYLLRGRVGMVSAASSGTWTSPAGTSVHLDRDSFRLNVLGWWKSPHSGASYPSSWSLEVVPLGLQLHLEPNLSDQELDTSQSTGVTYWEGSIFAHGKGKDGPLSGEGYAELTGYAGPIGDRL